MTDVDYYRVLGVPPSASERSIRDAYLALVRRLHPDRVGPTGTARFQAITEAYDTLSNPLKRRQYDLRCERVSRPASPRSVRVHPRAGSRPEPLIAEPIPLVDEAETGPPTLERLFERIVSNFTDLARPTAERLQSCDLGVILTSREAAAGVAVPIAVPVVRGCFHCGGRGGTVLPCRACHGRGGTIRADIVRIRIPAMVRDGTVVEVPLGAIGVPNLSLRLHIVVREPRSIPMEW